MRKWILGSKDNWLQAQFIVDDVLLVFLFPLSVLLSNYWYWVCGLIMEDILVVTIVVISNMHICGWEMLKALVVEVVFYSVCLSVCMYVCMSVVTNQFMSARCDNQLLVCNVISVQENTTMLYYLYYYEFLK